jgi:hypothetical protein
MRLSTKGKSVSLEVSFWWVPKDNAIHIATNDKDPGADTFHVAIRDEPSKPSGQPYLFRELAKCLRSKGAPAPES